MKKKGKYPGQIVINAVAYDEKDKRYKTIDHVFPYDKDIEKAFSKILAFMSNLVLLEDNEHTKEPADELKGIVFCAFPLPEPDTE